MMVGSSFRWLCNFGAAEEFQVAKDRAGSWKSYPAGAGN